MVTRSIKCGACGYEGKVEAHDTVNVVPESEIFKLLGKDSSTGFLHFSCPSCNEDLAVDPLKAMFARQMVGYPKTLFAPGKAKSSNRYVPIICGIGGLLGAVFMFLLSIFIYAHPSGRWTYTYIATYIAVVFLLMYGWVSLKTGLFASRKEIKELTGPGPVSEETKRKFQDRI